MEERVELAVLQRKAVAYRDRVAPLPIEGARRLHKQLLETEAPAGRRLMEWLRSIIRPCHIGAVMARRVTNDAIAYRLWLRDEFAFRCVYCLLREQWGRVTGEFDVEHFRPQVNSPERG